MKIPSKWLSEFIYLPYPPSEIAKILTRGGLEVDNIDIERHKFEGVCIAKVLETSPHPQSEKLTIAQVFDGLNQIQVVCGAPNCKPGIKVALAQVGAKLCDLEGKEFVIKKAKIKGVESFGMLCSEKELNLGNESDKIMECNPSLQEGEDLASLYSEVVFEVSLTPNLGHCMSIKGVARELSALTGLSWQKPLTNFKMNKVHSDFKVSIKDVNNCHRYVGIEIRNVKVGPSPTWIEQKLTSSGLRPINNIVDITNYVLLELGHPLHAFDADKIDGKEIIIRTAEKNETITTLDDKKYLLETGDLLIADNGKAIAIAGVMGGLNSEVTNETKNVFLEGAYFTPSTVRRTSKRLGISTDASKRFERGTDFDQIIESLIRATNLILECCEGAEVSDLIDIRSKEVIPRVVECRVKRVNALLGIVLSVSEIEEIFKRLNFSYRLETPDIFKVIIPSYRTDISLEVDLIEEIGRIHGFDKIPKNETKYTLSKLPHSPIFLFEREMRSRLIQEGLQEFLTCDLIGPSSLDILIKGGMEEKNVIHVVNPTSIEQSILRTSLLPGLLQVVKFNLDHQSKDIFGFELGRIHFKDNDEKYVEQTSFGIILSGKRAPSSWDQKSSEFDYYDLKGIVENILESSIKGKISFQVKDLSLLHPGRQASIYIDDLEVGSLGEVHPAILRKLDINQKVYFAEINLHDLFPLKRTEQKMVAIPQYPGSERDWTISLSEYIPIYDLLAIIHSLKSNLLEDVTLVDIYRSEKIGKDIKNVTLHFVYRDLNKTISQEVVEKEHSRITESAKKLLEEQICNS